ncbi:MAG: DUF2190 family protein [Candidatus Omnitrophota bacterium]|jgi:hypothetical protein
MSALGTLGGNALKLRCPLEVCHNTVVTAPSGGYTAGQLLAVGDQYLTGVVYKDAAEGEDAVLIYKARRVVVPCVVVTSGSFDVGNRVFYDVADAEVNESASGNHLCGVVMVAPAVGAEEVEIELDGTMGYLTT